MIASVFVIEPARRTKCPFSNDGQKIVLDLSDQKVRGITGFDIEINFQQSIKAFRNHDYRWVNTGQTRVSNSSTPKAIKFENGYIQPSKQTGIWETIKNRPNQLLWRFNTPGASPLAVYHGTRLTRKIGTANDSAPESVTLLFSEHNGIEFSRSPIPFSAVACFTDHCDFDTAQNLALQRQLFKESGIRVTKGFFLSHHSSREDNASFENQSEELGKWRDDGHELAYHSLAQAPKFNRESFADFENFSPPFPNITTWIDHAYQHYNLSFYASNGKSDVYLGDILAKKNIRALWNYIDSGPTTAGVINQLNRDDFTLKQFLAGNRWLPFKKRFGLLIKTIMLHYYADEKIVAHYMYMAINFKKVFFRGQLRRFWPMFKNLVGLILPLMRVLLHWNRSKNQPFAFARYMPVVFAHRIGKHDFRIFQTLEMADFVSALAPKNIDKLITESGLFIAHTYFSSPISYHQGKMFSGPDAINRQVATHFKSLGAKVAAGNIWNPTLGELVEFLANFEKTVLDIDADGRIVACESSGLPYRNIT
jgi:hypothetical protein